MNSEHENLETPEDDYLARRDQDFKKNFKSNCDALYAEIARTISSQEKDGYSEKFYIGPVDFTDGRPYKNDKGLDFSWYDAFPKIIVDEMKKRNLQAKEKYANGKAQAEKKGEVFKGKPVFEFDEITYFFHTYYEDESHLHNDNAIITVTNNHSLYESMPLPKIVTKNSNIVSKYEHMNKPMIERDTYHRLAYKYFIDKGVVKLDDEEDMIFGDELL